MWGVDDEPIEEGIDVGVGRENDRSHWSLFDSSSERNSSKIGKVTRICHLAEPIDHVRRVVPVEVRDNAHELARVFRARIPSYTPANATAPCLGRL